MTKSELIHRIESLLPSNIIGLYRIKKREFLWSVQQRAYRCAEKRLRKKQDPLNVVFLVMFPSVWKYDSVYRLMQQDKRFNPTILVCPVLDEGKDFMIENLHSAIKQFTDKGYTVKSAYNEKSGKCISIKQLSPDIVMYSTLWTGHTDKKYNHYSLRKYLKCYINYGYCSISAEWGIASAFHGLMWRYFSECELNRQLALTFQPKEMQNIVVTGYPIYDDIRMAEEDNVGWKDGDPKFKRIIWAPHHSIGSQLVQFSTFLKNAEAILNLARKYKDTIQFAFKPHPQLLTALYSHPDWGKERTDKYYAQWADGENTTLVSGAYTSLFKSSDALIHDCGSFIVEYLYTQKPAMYLGSNREEQSNEIGKRAYAAHYHGSNIAEIEMFIRDVVIDGKDTMQMTRQEFYQSILVPPNGQSVAENIVDEISKVLNL